VTELQHNEGRREVRGVSDLWQRGDQRLVESSVYVYHKKNHIWHAGEDCRWVKRMARKNRLTCEDSAHVIDQWQNEPPETIGDKINRPYAFCRFCSFTGRDSLLNSSGRL
jgi:hypothetical protein